MKDQSPVLSLLYRFMMLFLTLAEKPYPKGSISKTDFLLESISTFLKWVVSPKVMAGHGPFASSVSLTD